MDTVFEIDVTRPSDDCLRIQLAGQWNSPAAPPTTQGIEEQLDERVRRIEFDTTNLRSWDTTLLTFLLSLARLAATREIEIDAEGLPSGAKSLLSLATAVPETTDARSQDANREFVERVGEKTTQSIAQGVEATTFVGDVALSLARFARGQARIRGQDLLLLVQECGAQALPIVTLISFLVGLILAFVGALQLQQFGAQIYVADLVGLGMAREMGAMMTGIIMAGRTGAAFAAQLGTMTVNEEIDALKTFGISPIDFLVLPRVVALVLMMPLLVLYADLMGILGGVAVGITILDLNLIAYMEETRAALTISDFVTGLVKGSVYGIIIAMAGCFRGIQSGRSAAAVGQATTQAVVTSIVLIVLASATLTVIYDVLGV